MAHLVITFLISDPKRLSNAKGNAFLRNSTRPRALPSDQKVIHYMRSELKNHGARKKVKTFIVPQKKRSVIIQSYKFSDVPKDRNDKVYDQTLQKDDESFKELDGNDEHFHRLRRWSSWPTVSHTPLDQTKR